MSSLHITWSYSPRFDYSKFNTSEDHFNHAIFFMFSIKTSCLKNYPNKNVFIIYFLFNIVKRGNWKYIIVLIALLLILSLILLVVNDSSSNNIYYGPPLSNAVYEQEEVFQAQNESSHTIFNVDQSWLGVNVIVNSSDVAQVKIYAISPEGQTVVTLERNFTGTPREISEIASFDPANINGQKEGNWTLNYEIIGGPVNIKIEKVSSFGTPQ